MPLRGEYWKAGIHNGDNAKLLEAVLSGID
jgi:hypothetical protein